MFPVFDFNRFLTEKKLSQILVPPNVECIFKTRRLLKFAFSSAASRFRVALACSTNRFSI